MSGIIRSPRRLWRTRPIDATTIDSRQSEASPHETYASQGTKHGSPTEHWQTTSSSSSWVRHDPFGWDWDWGLPELQLLLAVHVDLGGELNHAASDMRWTTPLRKLSILWAQKLDPRWNWRWKLTGKTLQVRFHGLSEFTDNGRIPVLALREENFNWPGAALEGSSELAIPPKFYNQRCEKKNYSFFRKKFQTAQILLTNA